jgi:hypothetical protein
MGRIKFFIILAVTLLALSTITQIGLAEWQNLQFQDELHDLSANLSENTGVVVPRTDDELRMLIVHKAGERGIDLDPKRITLQRTGSEKWHTFYLAVEYDAPIRLPGYFFSLHFAPSSTKKSFF